MSTERHQLTPEQSEAAIAMQRSGLIDHIERNVKGRIFIEWSRKETTPEYRERLFHELQALNRIVTEIKTKATAAISEGTSHE